MDRLNTKVFPKSRSTGVIVAIVAIILLFVAVAVLAWDPWLREGASETESNGDTARTVGLLLGGVVALVFGVWRALVAERQVESAQKQVEVVQRQAETAQKGLLNDRYQRAAEMLGQGVLAVRLGGIYALRRLAEEHPEEYYNQCMELLCAFARNPTKDEEIRVSVYEEWGIQASLVREDVQAAVSAIGLRDPDLIERVPSEGFKIDLRGVNLVGSDLRAHNLDGADLTNANLTGANLEDALIRNAKLVNAELTSAELNRATLSGSKCTWANFSGAKAQVARFGGACLEGAVWTGGHLEDALLHDAKLIGADMRWAHLDRTDLSRTVFGRGRRMVGEPPHEVVQFHYTSLTQAQLNQASTVSQPPIIRDDNPDSETNETLVWG